MKRKSPFHKTEAPCPDCPYRLGQVHTTVNPCPQCKLNDYQTYKHFKKLTPTAAEWEKDEDD